MNNDVTGNHLKNRIGDFTPLTVITASMVLLYVTANVMAVKLVEIGGIPLFDAGTITFPLAYMLGDVLAEVWGYKTAKKVIWLTFAMNAAFIFFTTIGIFLPYPAYMQTTQDAYVTIFTYVPRIVIASLIGFLFGEMMNAKVLVKMKERQKDGRLLALRTITSSIVGYLFDTVLFVIIAFAGTVPTMELIKMIVAQYVMKTLIEGLAGTPLAYLAIGYLRKNYSDR